MEHVVAQLISGIANGSTYALIVVGMTLLLLVRGVVHFGFPYIVVLTAYLGWMVLGVTGNNLFVSIPSFIGIGMILTLATEPLFRPLAQRRALLETLVLGQGLAIIMTDICSHFINRGQNISFPTELTGGAATIRFGIIYFSLADIYSLLASVIIVLILLFFLYRSKQGKAIRAMAQDLDIARSLGIPFKKTGIVGFTAAGILAGVSAILVAMTLEMANPALGNFFATKALVLMLFAGLGNLLGAMICALALGIIEALAQAYMPGQWTEAIVFGFIMIVILIRPNGVFGIRT